jgi:hypothetical protein|nr:MAG TPA: hypothetical protein [Caudoviricetes sp.]
MADDDKKTTVEEEKEEGFDLGAVLDGVRQATKTVKIYLDADAADKAFQLNGALLEARADAKDGVEQTMSIAEEAPTVRLERELKEAIAALNEWAMTFRLRALASKEMDVIRNVVVNKVKAPRNQNEEAANEFRRERQGVLNEYFLSHAVIDVTFRGKKRTGLSLDDAKKLHETLPATEWDRLTETFLEAQAALSAMQQVMNDPTFRWAVSDDAA